MKRQNPTITVIMRTFGSHNDMIGEAIESFLRQVYDNAELLIVNTHPGTLRLDKNYDNIKVINIKDEFNDEVSLNKYCLKLVTTDTWAILDDDDIMMPWCLSTLVQHWNYNIGTKCPTRVGRNRYTIWYGDREEDNVEEHPGTCWWNCLFQRIPKVEVDTVFRNFKNDRVTGSDSYIDKNTYYSKIDFESPPIYIWRRKWPEQTYTCFTGLDEYPTREQEWINYWENKRNAYSKGLPECIVPHWKNDYDVRIWNGVVNNGV